MNSQWEVTFTVYEDAAMTKTTSDLQHLRTVVEAFLPQQAEAMVRAQYGGRAHIWSVYQKS